MQHAALEILRRHARPVLKLSAIKLYLWLCSASTTGLLEATASKIKKVTELNEDTVKSAREELVRLNLIKAKLELGQGAKYTYTVLNLKTGEPYRASEDSGVDGYFQVPRLYLFSETYKIHSGSTILVYLSVLADGNRLNTTKLRHSRSKIAKIASLTQKTASKALVPLTSGDLPFLRIEPGTVEILNPETGKSFAADNPDRDGLHFVDAEAGHRVSVDQLLTPENFKEYFCSELEDLDPEISQQDVCCPFHSDTHPSMSINLDEGVWFCHVCQDQKSGMLAFEMKRLGTEDKQVAWKSIAKKLGVQLMPKKRGAMTHEHVYRDAGGEVLYAVRRYEDGTARFYTPTATGEWKPGLNGAKRVPYHLSELMEADVAIITEGEKKADAVQALGLHDMNGKPVAVTCTGAADSWRSEYVEHFIGKQVVLYRDTDEAGERYAHAVTASLTHAGIQHQIIDFEPFGNDVRDFLQGRSAAELVEYTQCEWLVAPEAANLSVPEPITMDLSLV